MRKRPVKFCSVLLRFPLLLVASYLVTPAPSSDPVADRLLKQALHSGDLYNWIDSAQPFSEAEKLFIRAGDRRNALYARLGYLRATMEQRSLPTLSEQLGTLLDREPLLQNDLPLRLFAYTVKGDVDGELDPEPARHDWEAVLSLAKQLGNQKWMDRASAEIGFSDFLEGKYDTAQKRVFGALAQVKAHHDVGAQMRYSAAIGTGLVLQGKAEAALEYFEQADQLAAQTPGAGYQYVLKEGRLQALRHLKGRNAEAQKLADEMLREAKQRKKYVKEAQILITSAWIAKDRKDDRLAIADLRQSIELSRAGGFKRFLAEAQFVLSDTYRLRGELQKAQEVAAEGVVATPNRYSVNGIPGDIPSS